MPSLCYTICNEPWLRLQSGRQFIVGTDKKETIEGKLWRINYYPQASLKIKPSEVQILRNFNTGNSESNIALEEITKLMKMEPGLKLYVVGHTDNVGGLEYNSRLSQDRAEAVVQALVRERGVDATRVKSFGNGPYAPVATNETEEGRAKNRRVELVKQ